jgi:hypothetical protein
MSISNILEATSDQALATEIVQSFQEIEKNFYLKAWKVSELDAGHFVEAVRRFIEFKLFGNYTPIGTSLANFNDVVLKRYESASGDDSYRIHIPRSLLIIYGIRNKRGVGHLGNIKPNKIDASLILSISKWVLAELVRLNSTHDIIESECLIDEIIERNIEGIWETGTIKRVLIDGLSIQEQILLLLFNSTILTDKQLYDIIENGNYTYLKQVLKALHTKRLIEYNGSNGQCLISPKGSAKANKILELK